MGGCDIIRIRTRNLWTIVRMLFWVAPLRNPSLCCVYLCFLVPFFGVFLFWLPSCDLCLCLSLELSIIPVCCCLPVFRPMLRIMTVIIGLSLINSTLICVLSLLSILHFYNVIFAPHIAHLVGCLNHSFRLMNYSLGKWAIDIRCIVNSSLCYSSLHAHLFEITEEYIWCDILSCSP